MVPGWVSSMAFNARVSLQLGPKVRWVGEVSTQVSISSQVGGPVHKRSLASQFRHGFCQTGEAVHPSAIVGRLRQ